ncbi:hypothetical protein PV328_004734 [Microctonus aethiopoides]|uniref:Major facilitator superfamily (MFS) profile domain-containing protein n=1 Tax=Microctonus aethiopoides TaxID=144406 RepID=A0AA39KM16_9HYME|nr:hypothetical protein PV328_004734 [Microctonus aethiopoides]
MDYKEEIEMNSRNLLPDKSEIKKHYEPAWHDILPQIIASCISFGIVIQAGVNMAYSTVLIDGLSSNKSDIAIDTTQTAWITSLVTLSTPIGSLIAGPLMDNYGRKTLCIATCLPIILSWIFLSFTKSILIIFIARILGGFASGLTTVSLVYTMEISHPRIRGMLLCVNSIAVAFGILLSCLLALFLNWREMAMFFIALNILIFFALIFIIPESPYWLVYFGNDNHDVRDKKIHKSLKFLNPKPMIYEQEYSRIQEINCSRQQNKAKNICDIFKNENWKIMTTPNVYKPLILLIIIILAQQLSGTYVVIFYAISIFRNVGGKFNNGLNEYGALLLLGIIRFVTSIITAFLSRSIGRRTLCIVSGIGMAISMFIATIYLYTMLIIDNNNQLMIILTEHKWILLCVILFYVFTSSFGFAVIPWTLIGELLPISFRGIGGGFMVSFAYIVMFIVVQNYPNAIVTLGPENIFLFFGIMSLIGTIVIYYFLPETLGKSLTEIEKYFSTNKYLEIIRNNNSINSN